MTRWVSIATVALSLVSCTQGGTSVALVAVPTASQVTPPTETPISTPPRVKPTATLRPSRTPEPPLVCPDGTKQSALPAPKNLGEFREPVLNYLNTGGDLRLLPGVLKDSGMSAEVEAVDLNGDQLNELIVLLDYPTSPDYGHESAVWTYRCTRTGLYAEAGTFMDGLYTWEPTVYAITDLTGDRHPEVIVQGTWSGSACEMAVAAIGEVGNAIVDHFFGKVMPGCPGTISINQAASGDLPTITLHGETSTSLGGGPSRGVAYTYRWRASDLALIDERLDASPLRIHVLEDAQRALDGGDFDEAIRLYNQAAHDEALENVASQYYIPFINSGLPDRDVPEKYQPAFALFRLGAIYHFLGKADEFALTLAELGSKYPSGTPGGEFVDLLTEFQEGYQSGGNPIDACQAVGADIRLRYPDLEHHIGDWGYANVSYVATTICPFNDGP